MFEKAISNFLLAESTLTTPAIGQRAYPLKLPQKTGYPAICYTRISSARGSSQDGPASLVEARYQFNVYDATLKDAKTIAEKLRRDLDGFKGTMGTGGDLTQIDAVFLEDDRDGWDDDLDIPVVMLDFTFFYQEQPNRS